MIIVRRIVAPSPNGPIDCGIYWRTRSIDGGYVREVHNEPYPKSLPDALLISYRRRRIDGIEVNEYFVPPVPEADLSDATYPEAILRYEQS